MHEKREKVFKVKREDGRRCQHQSIQGIELYTFNKSLSEKGRLSVRGMSSAWNLSSRSCRRSRFVGIFAKTRTVLVWGNFDVTVRAFMFKNVHIDAMYTKQQQATRTAKSKSWSPEYSAWFKAKPFPLCFEAKAKNACLSLATRVV